MTIEIPDDIYEDFKAFLDIAQSSYLEEEVEDFDPQEKKCLEFIENLIGENRCRRNSLEKNSETISSSTNSETIANILMGYEE